MLNAAGQLQAAVLRCNQVEERVRRFRCGSQQCSLHFTASVFNTPCTRALVDRVWYGAEFQNLPVMPRVFGVLSAAGRLQAAYVRIGGKDLFVDLGTVI